MTIKDTCRCGAKFEVDDGVKEFSTAHIHHKAWLEAHKVCRTPAPESAEGKQ